ncbi:unnamed protein product [Ostreobium quekettii]|uniref:Uncharacterized protein n=1 Tax=Ostreobium quekettii TaxID=121088 RepID=A0A8S1IUP3_9CHLO|nr:unnamed protein product [Ostreobium quekettii]
MDLLCLRHNRPNERLRGWYKIATSQPKNVIVVVEASEKMGAKLNIGDGDEGSKKRWHAVKDILVNFMGTLDVDDYFNILVFNNATSVLLNNARNESTLVKASERNVGAMIEELEKVVPAHGSDSGAAMNEAFDVFERSFRPENDHQACKVCQKIIVVISDGSPCTLRNQSLCFANRPESAAAPGTGMIERSLDEVERRQRSIEEDSQRAAIFTLTMLRTQDDGDSLPRQMACRNRGVWSRIDGQKSPLNDLAAYFQYIAFSREQFSIEDQFLLSPLYEDASGLGTITTATCPVFISPRCANGKTSTQRLLLGVVAKDAPIAELRDKYGLNEDQIRNAIRNDLTNARRCDGNYDYGNCKMQVLRGSALECPILRRDPPLPQACYRLRNVTYMVNATRVDFQAASRRCSDAGGRLADLGMLSVEGKEVFGEARHFLSTVVPPDGAWMGLQLVMRKWAWLGSNAEADFLQDELSLRHPGSGGSCFAGFIDPRGARNNFGGENCQEEKAFVCAFDDGEDSPPLACRGEVEVIDHAALNSATAQGCLQSEGCDEIEDIKAGQLFADKRQFDAFADGVVCRGNSRGAPKSYSELVCCSEETLERECPAVPSPKVEEIAGPGLLNTSDVPGISNSSHSLAGGEPKRTNAVTITGGIGVLVGVLLIGLTLYIAARHKVPWMRPVVAKDVLIGGDPQAPDRVILNIRPDTPDTNSSGSGEISEEGSSHPPASVSTNISDIVRNGPFQPKLIDLRPPPRIVRHPPVPVGSRNPLIWDIKVVLLENGWSASGAFGVVNEGVWVDGQSRAHKVAIKSAARLWSQSDAEYIKRELEIVAAVPESPNIVRVIGGRLLPTPIIVEELMWGSLEEVLHKDTKYSAGLTYGQILSIASDVVAGLEHLHRHGVIHYDIKPGNILLEELWDAGAEASVLKAKLADFTCSKIKLKCSISASLRGTLGYIAPELQKSPLDALESRKRAAAGATVIAPSSSRAGLIGSLKGERCDVYSLGVVIVECVTGTNEPSEEGVLVAQRLCPEPLWALAKECAGRDPETRPECCEIGRRLEEMKAQRADWIGQRPKEHIWGARQN